MNINHIVGTKKKTTKDILINESSWEEVESHENDEIYENYESHYEFVLKSKFQPAAVVDLNSDNNTSSWFFICRWDTKRFD